MKNNKVKSVSIRINLEDKKFLEKLLEEGKYQTVAECVSIMIRPHRIADKLMAMHCPRCEVEIPHTYSTNVYETHCIKCRDQAVKLSVYKEIQEERLLS